MIEDGDETAVALFAEFNQIMMPDQKLSNSEIALVLDYIEVESAPKNADANPIKRPEPYWASNNSRPMLFTDYLFWVPFTLSVFFVVFILYYRTVITDLRKENQ